MGPVSVAWVGVLAAAAVLVGGLLVHDQSSGLLVDAWSRQRLELSPSAQPVRYSISWWVGTAADPAPAGLLVGLLTLLCLVTRRIRLAALTVVAPLVVDASSIALKHVVGRTIHGDNLSYPSTHAAQGAVLSMVAALIVAQVLRFGRRGTMTAVLGAGLLGGLLMAWSLVADSVHYATDTLAGIGVAIALMPVCARAVDVVADHVDEARRARHTDGPVPSA